MFNFSPSWSGIDMHVCTYKKLCIITTCNVLIPHSFSILLFLAQQCLLFLRFRSPLSWSFFLSTLMLCVGMGVCVCIRFRKSLGFLNLDLPCYFLCFLSHLVSLLWHWPLGFLVVTFTSVENSSSGQLCIEFYRTVQGVLLSQIRMYFRCFFLKKVFISMTSGLLACRDKRCKSRCKFWTRPKKEFFRWRGACRQKSCL